MLSVLADCIQALGVPISLGLAVSGYVRARRNSARTALRKALNTADEFTLLLDDDSRYMYFESNPVNSKTMNIDIWIDEVENFNDEFKKDLNALWGALDNLHLRRFTRKYSATLNSGNLVQKNLEKMLFVLQIGDKKNVQYQKERTAQILLNFSNQLYELAHNTKLIPSNNLDDLYQSLKCYVENRKLIVAAITKFRFCKESHLKYIGNNEECFLLSNMYNKRMREKIQQQQSAYSWKALKEQIQISDADVSLKDLYVMDGADEKDSIAMDIVRGVARRETLQYDRAKFKLIQKDSDKRYRVILKKINYKFKKLKIRSHFQDLNDPKSWQPGYKFSDIVCNFHSRKYPKLAS